MQTLVKYIDECMVLIININNDNTKSTLEMKL